MMFELLPAAFLYLAIPPAMLLAAVVVYLAWTAGKEQERVEKLAARLRRLCRSTGRPEIRTLRPRRLGLSLDLRPLERTLLSLERDQGIPGRRMPNYRRKYLLEDLDRRISRLEERGLG